ncbi:MAG: DNA methyltransferase [Planctomycetota bacterium]
MKLTKEQAKENLAELIAKYEKELSADKLKDYNEEATKLNFIQPLLKDVLGWDVNNRDEVSPEENVSRGRVDYGLKINDRIKVYVEAKTPKDGLMGHVEQALKYGYNKKNVPFVLLTNFDETWLFDVTVKPNLRNPLKGRKSYLKYDQYLDYFDELWQLSKESAVNGELDKLLLKKSDLAKLPVDKAILADLKRWREILAKDIFKNNPKLFDSGDKEKDAVYLKEITQKLLDRIVFMRSCEDRGLVHRSHLNVLFEERTETVGTNTMLFLKNEFESYNRNFDSDLFRPQEWEKDLAIDFTIMEEIIKDSYNPYQFDVIPLEVLGNIYEEYLGDTIRLTDQQVKYEMKLEVRKAGGVYYTPEYIVDYIVKNTIGKLLNELPHNKIKELKILDPACGSGSFLIRAYEEMLNYYRRQKKGKLKSTDGQKKLHQEEELPHLDIFEKRRILVDHIYGVDLDDQAVEVTKLSLMLKMLDGEHGTLTGYAILPMLDSNIKCGNSLVSGDAVELKKFFGDEWYKVKPFNWDKSFAHIMKKGGFDVVIGNPPYFNIDKVWGKESPLTDFIKENYPKIHTDKTDILFYFLAKSINLSKHTVGFIVSRAFLEAYKAKKLREFILSSAKIISITDFDGFHVFEAGISTTIPILEVESNINKRNKNKIVVTRLKTPSISADQVYQSLKNKDNASEFFEVFNYDQKDLGSDSWNFVTSAGKDLNSKIDGNHPKISEICDVGKGMETGRNDVFGNLSLQDTKRLKLELNWVKKRATNSDIKRYFIIDRSEYLIYIEDIPSFKEAPKNIMAYIKSHEVELKERAAFQRGDCEWWKYTWPLHKEWYSKIKILCPYLAGENRFALDSSKEFISLTDTTVIFSKGSLKENIKYVLALLNSKLLTYRFRSIGKLKSKGIYEYFWNSVSKLPICTIDFSNASQKKLHDKIVGLVDIMLDLNKKIQDAKGSEQEQIQKQIDQTDNEIDELVYKLYGLTEKEIKVIEEVKEGT